MVTYTAVLQAHLNSLEAKHLTRTQPRNRATGPEARERARRVWRERDISAAHCEIEPICLLVKQPLSFFPKSDSTYVSAAMCLTTCAVNVGPHVAMPLRALLLNVAMQRVKVNPLLSFRPTPSEPKKAAWQPGFLPTTGISG